MKHMTRAEALRLRVLDRARTVAVIGASADPERHSNTVAAYLKAARYDVVPVRPDRASVAGLQSFPSLAAVPGPVDLVVIFRRRAAVPAHIEEAAAKEVEAVWLPPGVCTPEAEETAKRLGLQVIKDVCIAEEHRHLWQASGHPAKAGVHVRRRKPTYEDNRRRPEDSGYAPGGGGGRVAGGGVRAIVDEKKMVKGAPSRRTGVFKPKPR